MTGTIDRGSLIFDKVVPAESLKVGDIITYTPPASSATSAT
jgi:signal peptidase